MSNYLRPNPYVAWVFIMMHALATLSPSAVRAADESQVRLAGGMAVYLGVVPAEIVKGHSPAHPERQMHGGASSGRHRYHVMAAIFDDASSTRISDATVTAQVSGLGLAGSQQKLDAMEIANTITYGAFFDLPGRDLYTVRLTIERPGVAESTIVEFKYDHRLRGSE